MDLIGQFATSAARMLQNGKSECFNLLNFEVDLAYLWMKIYDNRFFCVIFIVNDIISFSVKFKEKQTRKVRFYQRHMNNYHDYKCL